MEIFLLIILVFEKKINRKLVNNNDGKIQEIKTHLLFHQFLNVFFCKSALLNRTGFKQHFFHFRNFNFMMFFFFFSVPSAPPQNLTLEVQNSKVRH